MKKPLILVISILIILLFIAGGLFLRNKNIHQGTYTNDEGITYDCISKRKTESGGWRTYVTYYNNRRILLGTCSAYNGPGSSGGNKTTMQCDQLSVKNELTRQVIGNGDIMLTVPKYECSAQL